MRALVLIAAVAVAACSPTQRLEVVPLPAVACAAVEPEPVSPVITDVQRLSVDVATINAVGVDLAVPLIRFRDVEHPAWGRRQANRLEEIIKSCPNRELK